MAEGAGAIKAAEAAEAAGAIKAAGAAGANGAARAAGAAGAARATETAEAAETAGAAKTAETARAAGAAEAEAAEAAEATEAAAAAAAAEAVRAAGAPQPSRRTHTRAERWNPQVRRLQVAHLTTQQRRGGHPTGGPRLSQDGNTLGLYTRNAELNYWCTALPQVLSRKGISGTAALWTNIMESIQSA